MTLEVGNLIAHYIHIFIYCKQRGGDPSFLPTSLSPHMISCGPISSLLMTHLLYCMTAWCLIINRGLLACQITRERGQVGVIVRAIPAQSPSNTFAVNLTYLFSQQHPRR